MSDTYKHCMEQLREGDRDRYRTVLFAPEDKRPALAALYAFSLETERVRELVSEPMPGEIRLQWWREVVSGKRDGEGRQHPVGAALLDAIAANDLSRDALANLTEARIFDLYNDPMPDRVTLEGFLGETVSVLFQLSVQVLDPVAAAHSTDAAGHAGVAYGISRLLRRAPAYRENGQVYMPADTLAAVGTDARGWLKGDDREAMARATAILVALGREHLGKANAGSSALGASARPAFMPLAGLGYVFGRVERAGAAHAFRFLNMSPLRLSLAYLRRAATG